MKEPKIKQLQDLTVLRRTLKLANTLGDKSYFYVCHGMFEVLGIGGNDYTKLRELHPELCEWITKVGREHCELYRFSDAWTTMDKKLNGDEVRYNAWKRDELKKQIEYLRILKRHSPERRK